MNKQSEKELCLVCALPASKSPCSERCHGLAKIKDQVEAKNEEIRPLILNAVAKLKTKTTECPGMLAHKVLESVRISSKSKRDSLTVMRSIYLKLRDDNKIRFYQKGSEVALGKYPSGPFRIGR